MTYNGIFYYWRTRLATLSIPINTQASLKCALRHCRRKDDFNQSSYTATFARLIGTRVYSISIIMKQHIK